MKYTFGAKVIIAPIRLQRLEQEKQQEKSLCYTHQANPFREMDDEMTILAEVESPKGMSNQQQQAFERAMNRSLRQLRYFIDEEFSEIKNP